MRAIHPTRLSASIPLALLLMAASTPSRACDRTSLRAFAPDSGEILMSKGLARTEQVTEHVELRNEIVTCPPEESDPDCKARLVAETGEGLTEGQTVTVELQGPTLGVYARMKGNQGEMDGLFDSYEALADHMETPDATAQELVLVLAEPALDRIQRQAIVRVVEERVKTRDLPPGLRVLYRPEGSSLEALDAVQQAARGRDIQVVAWQYRDDGTVTLDLRCDPE